MVTNEFYSEQYTANFAKTVAFLHRKGVETDLARDLSQDAWTRAWQFREQWRGDCTFKTWTFVIVNGVWRDYVRSPKRRESEELKDKAFAVERADDLALVWEAAKGITSMVGAISHADWRTVVEMRLRGMPFEEIAAALGTNDNTVKTWSHRGIAEMKKKAMAAGA